MKLITFYAYLLFVRGLLARSDDVAMSRHNFTTGGVLLRRSGNHNGRVCDFSDGHYVDWVDTSDAIEAWCSNNAGHVVHKGDRMAQTVRKTSGGDYLSGTTKVKLYGKFRQF